MKQLQIREDFARTFKTDSRFRFPNFPIIDAESHRRGLPLLSNEAISRESIYDDTGLQN